MRAEGSKNISPWFSRFISDSITLDMLQYRVNWEWWEFRWSNKWNWYSSRLNASILVWHTCASALSGWVLYRQLELTKLTRPDLHHVVGLFILRDVRPSVRPSVCRRHGFRSISQVCFGISIWNFICMLMVAIGRSLSIFSEVTFKMVAWQPYWFFWFPDSNLTLALNINFKLQRHNTYVYG